LERVSVGIATKGILFTIFFSMIINLSTIPTGLGQGTTQLKVVAPTTDIQVLTEFNVDVTIVDVADLFAWQIKLYYNPTVLLWLDATYPPGHVFDGKDFYSVPPVNDTDTDGVSIIMTATLLGAEPGFSGSGTLCRISFKARAAATLSPLTLDVVPLYDWTWLWDSALHYIPFAAVDGSVTVVGVDPRQPSAISVNVDKSFVIVGDNVTIGGAINVTVADNTPVYIEYWRPDVNRWESLGTAYTTGSQFSYIWAPNASSPVPSEAQKNIKRDWNIRAGWKGDANYKEAVSQPPYLTVEVVVPWAWIKVDPKSIAVGSATAPKDLPTSPFNMTIKVQNVTDLFEWQIRVHFNQTILEALDAWIPSDNIFGDSHTPLQKTIDNTAGFIQANTTSTAGAVNVTGTGILFQMSFRGIGAPKEEAGYRIGEDTLVFDTTFTQLKNSTGGKIYFNLEAPTCDIAIFAKELRDPSNITLEIPSPVKVGSNVTITGQLTAKASGAGIKANITISYNVTLWSVTVLTENDGKYSYVWNANKTGTYNFKARWKGNADYISAESEEKVVQVQETIVEGGGGPDIMLYAAVGGIAVIAVVAVVVYLKIFRKPPQPL